MDTLQGREVPDAQAYLERQIADACGGDQCVSVRLVPEGSLEPEGRTGCTTVVVAVEGKEAASPTEPGLPPGGTSVLVVPRGGVITLTVGLQCLDAARESDATATSPP